MVLVVAVCLTILALAVYRPAERQRQRVVAEEFRRDLLLFKLKAVREYYEPLQRYTYREIAERYDVERAYNRIGKAPRRQWDPE